jgi:hypothetical protein
MKLVPPDTPIGRYMRFCANSETPHAYDFWTAVWLVTSVVGRNVVVDRPGAPIYLNYFAILVADSGVTRKSTAVRRAMKLYRQVKPQTTRLIESKITPEMLEFNLTQDAFEHGHSHAVIAIDELVKFLGREKYVAQMPTLLTDVYDCPDLRMGGGTLTRGSSILKSVFVSFLSASTPSWLLRAVNPDVIEGGFTSRVIFVVCEEPKRMSPWPEPPEAGLEEQILSDLRDIQSKGASYGQVLVNDTAKKRFSNWYRSRPLYKDSFRASFQSREDAHILKLAAVLAINDGCWEIQANHLTTAIKIITETREDGASIFEGTGANAEIIAGLDKLRDTLISAGMGGAKQSELAKAVRNRLSAKQVTTALEIMHELDLVQRFSVPAIGAGRPSTVWRATKYLADSKALNLMIDRFNE